MRRSGNPWLVVVGSMIGLIVGNGPIVLFTFGVLLTPITKEFGWGRGTIGAAELFAHMTAALATPFVGRFIDHWGVRPVGLVFITLFALSGVAIAATPPSPAVFVLLYAIWGLFSSGQTVMPYAKAVATTFDAKRGLALGVAMAGVGIGTFLIPQLTAYLVEQFGWRGAYVGLGATTFIVAFPAMAFLVGRADANVPRRRAADAAPLPGLTAHDAALSWRFWAIGLAAFLVAVAVNGTIPHVVPLLRDRGIPLRQAAAMMGAAGLSTIVGRIVSGYLLDRLFAPYVAAAFFMLPVIGIGILAAGTTGFAPLAAIILLGLGLGAEIDLIGFMVSRYFGIRAFGEIYGYVFALFALGSGFGPWAMGVVFDATHSYALALGGAAGALMIAALLVIGLGGYGFPAPRSEDGPEPILAN